MFSEHILYKMDINSAVKLYLPWEQLNSTSVLITGATGMIGTFLIDILMEANRRYDLNLHIFALGRSLERANNRFSEYMGQNNFTFIAKDINKHFELKERFNYIIHCASNTHPKAYATAPIETIITNVLGTQNILNLAIQSNSKRVLFLSSVEIYGETYDNVKWFREDDCGYINCNTLRAGYPEGKRTGEALCQAYIHEYHIDVVIPRICRVFGPTMLESDSKALMQFIKNAVSGEDIILKSAGTQYFSYCYVGDVSTALLYLLFYGKSGEAYNIADEKSDIQLLELAKILADLSGTKVRFDLPDSIEATGFSKCNIALLNSEKIKGLGWSVNNSIKEQLEKTINILKAI